MVKKKTSPKQVSVAIVLASVKKQMKAPIAKLNRITTVTNNEQNVIVADNIKALMEIRREVERQHRSITGPIKEGLKKIDALFEPTYETIDERKGWGKEQIAQFRDKQRKKVNELEQSFASGKIRKGTTLMAKQEALQVDMGSASSRKVWAAIEVNGKLTPREFLIPDESKIRQALKEGKKVKGWEWKQVEQIAI